MTDRRVIRNETQCDKLVAAIRCTSLPFLNTIDRAKPPGSSKQIAYCHSMANALADARGVAVEKAKFDLKLAFGVWTASTNVVTGDRCVDVKSWADYTREEMAGFIPAVEVFLNEEGIDYIPSDWRES